MKIRELEVLLAPVIQALFATALTCAVILIACNVYLGRIGLDEELGHEHIHSFLTTRTRRVMFYARSSAAYVLFAILLAVTSFGGVATTVAIGFLFLESMRHWWGIPLSALVACGLFYLRSRQRVLYGLMEIFVGLAAISAAVFGSYTSDLGLIVAALSGIYVIVRGLDNFGQGLPTAKGFLPESWHSQLSSLWARLTQQ